MSFNQTNAEVVSVIMGDDSVEITDVKILKFLIDFAGKIFALLKLFLKNFFGGVKT